MQNASENYNNLAGEKLSASRVITDKNIKNSKVGYAANPIKNSAVIEGDFYQEKPVTIQEMMIRRINKSLCVCLILTICVTFVSYYIAMNYEAKLNALDREIVKINAENQDLQAELDKYKSFNNVDSRIGKFKLLQKANKVIEVTALNTAENSKIIPAKVNNSNFEWALGY